MSSVVDITQEPRGDMVIKVGKDEDARLVRVHSVFLKLGSDVFRAMLSTRFAEGGKSFTEDDPLDLEDDDPDAFIKLCKVLHHQVRDEGDLGFEDLPKLAIIADKYGATMATKPTFAYMLGPLFGPKVDLESDDWRRAIGLEEMICISYIMGDAQLFWRTTRRFLARTDGSAPLPIAHPELLNLVSNSLPKMVRALRSLELDKLESLLQLPFHDTFDQHDDQENFCSEINRVIAKWTYACWYLKMGFKPLAKTDWRLVDLWKELEHLAREHLDLAPTCKTHRSHYPWDDLMGEVLEGIEKSQRELRGLCLHCVREQAPGRKDGCEHLFEK